MTNQYSLFVEDSPVKVSPLQEGNEVRMMTAISGEKCLTLLNKRNPDGLLHKMCEELLRHKTAWHSTLSTLTWKVKVTKSKRLIYQLSAKVHGTDEKEFGLLPTPTVGCEEGGEQSDRVEISKTGSFLLRKKNPNAKHKTFGAKLSDAMLFLEKKKIYSTPTTNDSKNLTFPKSQTNRTSIIGEMIRSKQTKPGGKLNPNFVEFLMGFPTNWTKIEQEE